MLIHTQLPDPPQQVIALLVAARHHSGLSLRELAERAETSHATLSAYERGHKTPSAAVMLRIIQACNVALDFHFSKRIRSAEGLARGEELKQALLLAEQFPARVSKTLEHPPFPVTDGPKAR